MSRSQMFIVSASALAVAGLAVLSLPITAPVLAALHSNQEEISPVQVMAPADESASGQEDVDGHAEVAPGDDASDTTTAPEREDEVRRDGPPSNPGVDLGPRTYANGTVTLNDEGRVLTYTVAPGDTLLSIGDRVGVWAGDLLDVDGVSRYNRPLNVGDIVYLP